MPAVKSRVTGGSAAWELRSVNQRYLETYFRLPEQFRSLEPVVRERIRARLTRGKVECTLRFEQDPSAQGELILNEKLAKQLVNAANWVKMQSDEGEINPVDILRWPGVMAAKEQDLDAIAADILAALDGALDDFIVARETEGQALKALIEQRLEGVERRSGESSRSYAGNSPVAARASGRQAGRCGSAAGK
ncbi:protein YicC [Klebsiella pneumoniae]|uniref:Protein YicC n=1 Tax=Klebsiella pneumoniae TaxID=573 RepID=A0A2X3C5K1_KLEPN|nr:protein YicC [Klebsiella pneumoniae]